LPTRRRPTPEFTSSTRGGEASREWETRRQPARAPLRPIGSAAASAPPSNWGSRPGDRHRKLPAEEAWQEEQWSHAFSWRIAFQKNCTPLISPCHLHLFFSRLSGSRLWNEKFRSRLPVGASNPRELHIQGPLCPPRDRAGSVGELAMPTPTRTDNPPRIRNLGKEQQARGLGQRVFYHQAMSLDVSVAANPRPR
jgi:hypothetical protein